MGAHKNQALSTRQGRFFRFWVSVVLLWVILAGIGVGWLYHYARTPISGPAHFVLEPGRFLHVVKQLQEQKIIGRGWPFRVLAQILRAEKRIKAGSYELTGPTTPWDLLKKLVAGDASMTIVRIQEGWNWQQLKAALLANPNLKQDIRAFSDTELAARMQSFASHPEGLFFPDTYHVSRGSSTLQLLVRAHQRLHQKLTAVWDARDRTLPLKSPYEVLILASLIEKETGDSADRPMIAGVFVNRLRIGMRLQTDPSVIYGLNGRFDGNLRRDHLKTDTAYNSYTRHGLPPTPIAMVGEGSLKAATHPVRTSALYFVSRGNGRSQFSSSLRDHNKAVKKYILTSRGV